MLLYLSRCFEGVSCLIQTSCVSELPLALRELVMPHSEALSSLLKANNEQCSSRLTRELLQSTSQSSFRLSANNKINQKKSLFVQRQNKLFSFRFLCLVFVFFEISRTFFFLLTFCSWKTKQVFPSFFSFLLLVLELSMSLQSARVLSVFLDFRWMTALQNRKVPRRLWQRSPF